MRLKKQAFAHCWKSILFVAIGTAAGVWVPGAWMSGLKDVAVLLVGISLVLYRLSGWHVCEWTRLSRLATREAAYEWEHEYQAHRL